jgi:hypothetical protein
VVVAQLPRASYREAPRDSHASVVSGTLAPVRTHGWPYPFEPRPWPDIQAQFTEFAAQHPTFSHMAAIVDSIRTVGAEAYLAGCPSMHDLIVVSKPIPDPPYDVVAVRSPSSIENTPTGQIIIEHLSVTGHNDRIARPVEDAVPLFWRFIIEKYGVDPQVINPR